MMNFNELSEQLDQNLDQAAYMLKQQYGRHSIFSKKYLYKKNWSLVIGAEQSGKTSLLKQGELTCIQDTEEDGHECNVWFGQDGVFIELPKLCLDNTEDNETISRLIHSVKKCRRKKPFDNIIITINIYPFVQGPMDYSHYFETLQLHLQKALNPHLKTSVNLYIVFTHLDRIAGFCDFFSDFSSQNTSQALGYLFDDYSGKSSLLEQNEKKYYRLIDNLHQNLINLLHKASHHLTRYLIREFPLQMESLSNVIRTSVSQLADINHSIKIKGLFFTSAHQGGVCIDRISSVISHSYQLDVTHQFPQAARHQPYFIKGLIKTIARHHSHHAISPRRYQRWHRPVFYLGSAFALGWLFFIGSHYYESSQKIQRANNALISYQKLVHERTNASLEWNKLIPELSYLATARYTLSQLDTPWFIPFKNLARAKDWINTQYLKKLSEQFLPYLAHEMEIRMLSERDLAAQYAALKAYLMLGHPRYLDETYLKSWLHRYLKISSETDLRTALKQPFPGIALNKNIIMQVRNNLLSLPQEYLTYLIIKDQSNQTPEILTNPIFQITDKAIPAYYIRANFEKQYAQVIPGIIKKLQQESWVLNNAGFNRTSIEGLTKKIRGLYLSDYLNWWRLFIYHTQPKTFNNFDQALVYFNEINKNPSVLMNMFRLIQKNLKAFDQPDAVQQIFNQYVASQFTDIQRISTHSIQAIIAALNHIKHYMAAISTTSNIPETAFRMTREKFIHTNSGDIADPIEGLITLSQNMPEPAKSWFKQIASNSWFLLLTQTKSYINQQWKTSVLPEYMQNIANHFPVNASSEQDISLNNFAHFFGERGTLQTFFQNYLQPFLNTRQAQWVNQEVNGFSLSLHPEIILELERANVIRQMFFPANSLYPSVAFSLQAMELQPIVSRVVLNINGLSLAASQEKKELQYFTWPGSYASAPTTLFIQNITGEKFEITEYGPWGFFKLLAQANISSLPEDPQRFQVIFDINGSAAQYLLTTNTALNPFVPGIIQKFQLPGEII